MALITLFVSFLTFAHTVGSREHLLVSFWCPDRVLSPPQTSWEDFFKFSQSVIWRTQSSQRGRGRYLEGIWGHLGRTNSCLAGHREKQNVLRSRRRETQGPCEGEQSVTSPLGGEELRSCQLLPVHSSVSGSAPEAVALLLTSPCVHR